MKMLIARTMAVACAAAAFCLPARAQDVITLKLGGFLPKTHYGVVHGTQVFIDDVVARTKGKVKFEHYPAQQAGKLDQLMTLAASGALDVVEISPGSVSQKLPLSGVVELPGLVKESCSGSAALRAVGAAPGGVMHQSDFAPNGVRVLGFNALPPYQVVSRKPVSSVADLRGMKVRPAGAAMEVSMSKLGIVPVKMTGPELYDGISKGTIDAVMFTWLAARDYSLSNAAKFSAYGYPWGTGAFYIAISERKFQSLPRDVQDALLEAGKASEKRLCAHMQESEVTATKEAEAAGVKVHWWTDAQKAELDRALASVTTEWAKDLDSRGKPASRTIEEFRKAMPAR